MQYLEPRALENGGKLIRIGACLLTLTLASACSSLGASGPSARLIEDARGAPVGTADIKVIDVTEKVAQQALSESRAALLSRAIGDAPAEETIVGRGDVLQVTIWEAPPAVLFGTSASFGAQDSSSVMASTSGMGQRTSMPELMVDSDGMIRIPFAGSIAAAGRTPRQIEREIVARLTGKAHDPQVSVELATNANATVTVVGDLATNARVPLTPRGERLLDVIASAGGVKQPVGKMTIQVTRGERVASVPLDTIIHDPAQNIRLRRDDIVTALYQPFSFTSLGSTGTSAEVPFEGTGLTLAQALGRVGGLKDDRADIRGVFIFRFEDPEAMNPAVAATARRTPDGKIPVIYRVNLRDPSSFFVAQSFPIKNKDVLYVSSAPLSDFARFMGIASSMAFTAIGLGQAIPRL
jgi:polysaccharide export outer membrane protein